MPLEDAILQLLDTAPLPLKTGEIVKQVKALAGKQTTPKAVAAALDVLEGEGRLRSFVAGTAAKPKPAYTTQSLERAAAALLKPHIQTAKKAREAAKLKLKLPACLQPQFEPALAQLVTLGEVFVLAGAKRLVYAQKPKASSLLGATQRRALQKIFEVVSAARSSALTLADFIAWVDESGITVTGPQPDEPAPAQAEQSLTAALLREWYDADRQRSSTAMISVVQTYAHYEVWARAQGFRSDSQVLRNFMEVLYNNGLILLEPCERPQDLPAHERAMLVPMSIGPPGRSWCWSS